MAEEGAGGERKKAILVGRTRDFCFYWGGRELGPTRTSS